MGSISRALARAGYLRPVVDSLNELIQRRKYEQELQQLAEMLSGSENRMRDIYESKAYNTMEPSRTESNIDVDAKENLQPLGLDKIQKSSPLAYLSSVKPPERTPLPITDDKPVAPRIDIGQPEYEVLGDIKEGPKYTPQEQNRLAGQEINSFLRRLITSQNIPPEKIQLAGSLLQQLANTYKTEPRKTITVGKGQDVLAADTFEKLYENKDEGKGRDISGYELDDKGKPKVYTLDNGQKAFRKITKDADGNIINENYEEQSFPPKGNVTNVYLPGETGLTPETSKLIADIKNFDPYQKNKEGKYLKAGGGLATKDSEKIRMSPEDIKYAKDNVFENIKLQIFKKSPRAYQWVNNINNLWKDKGGSDYISPEDLNDEAIKHVKNGNLSDSDAAEIASFIKYYEQIYDGLTK